MEEFGEPVLPSQSKAYVRNSFPVNAQDQDPDDSYDLYDFHDNAKNPPDNGGESDNDGYQDIGAKYNTYHDLHDSDLRLGVFRFCETGLSLI